MLSEAEKATLPYRPCVGIVLAGADGRVFVGERIDTPEAWQMPQGGIDKGESPRGAALRELQEEVGVAPEQVTVVAETAGWVRYDLPDHLVGNAFKGRFRGQDQKWFLLRFSGSDVDVSIDTDHPEFARWQWMMPDDLLAAIVPFKRGVYEQVFAEFASRL